MAGLITIGGLATGLDTNTIITELVKLERRPIDLLQKQIEAAQATKVSVGTVSSKLAALRSAAQALSTADQVLARTATSSNESVLTAAAGLGAAQGSSTITVTQLARGGVAVSTVGVTATTDTVASGAGTFDFQVGSGPTQSVSIDGTTTLQGLADGINALGTGVVATAVNLGTTTSPDYRLQISSTATGAATTIGILQDDTTVAVQSTQTGLDAQFTLSGFTDTFSREANTFSDVLPGVTIGLKSLGTSTITASNDADAITEQVSELVTAFNDLVTFVNGESTVQQGSTQSQLTVGTLATDSTVKRVLSRARELLSGALTQATTKYVNLSSVGIATQRDGTVTFDEAAFKAAVGDDARAVAQVFAGNGTDVGVANDLATFIGQATGTGGTLGIRTSALDDQIRDLQDQIAAGERRVAAFELRLIRQFSALESLVSGLQSQSSFLTQAFGSNSGGSSSGGAS